MEKRKRTETQWIKENRQTTQWIKEKGQTTNTLHQVRSKSKDWKAK
jgi:hypothetical protein